MDLSIIIPIYNEKDNLQPMRERLEKLFAETLKGLQWEVLWVNDGSRDESLKRMLEIHRSNTHFKVLNLSRNFGHQVAITAGMEHAKGKAVVVMDGDLQDPPEVIAEMWSAHQSGVDVAYGQRNKRAGESWFKLVTASVFYRLLQKVARVRIPVDTGDFRMMSRRAVDALLQCRESHRFIRGLVSWVGYRQEPVFYDRNERCAGETKYPFTKMLSFAWDGITSFSTLPLKFATWIGSLTVMFGIGYGLWILFVYCFQPEKLEKGWSSIILLLLIIGGVQLLILGMIGEYLGRISDEIKGRPLYIVDQYHQGQSNSDQHRNSSKAADDQS